MNDILSTLQQYVLPHWPFVFMSFALGTICQFFKRKVWTLERAVNGGKFLAFMHYTLGIHAPVLGAVVGATGMQASPGIEGPLARALYHFVAGAMAAWTVAAWKHFMKSRGIVIAESIAPPSMTLSLIPDSDSDSTPVAPPPPAGK